MAGQRRDAPAIGLRADYSAVSGYAGCKSRCGAWLDEEFKELCGWIVGFNSLGPERYVKHYPSSTDLSGHALLEESARKRDIGVLLPTLTPEVQRHAYFEAVACSLSLRLTPHSEADLPSKRVNAFHEAWCEAFLRGRQRFALEFLVPMGAWGGKWAFWLVFDSDPQAAQCHCSPVVLPPPGIPVIPSAPAWSLMAPAKAYFRAQGMATPDR